MDKREMLDRLAANGDERLLLGRVWDKYEQCRRRNLPQGTGFLSPAEQAAAQRLLNALSVSEGYTFWGGYDGAQRRQLWFLPDWQEAPEEDAVRVVRAFGRERYEDEKFNAKNQRFSQLWIRLGKLLSVYWASGTLLTCLQVMVIVVIGACECVAGRMTLGTFVAFVTYNEALSWPVRSLGRVLSDMSKAGVSMDRVGYILNAREEQDAPDAVDAADGDIVFDHVTFGYQGQPVLRDVSFDTFLAKLPECRRQCGDRAVLRAFHVYADNDRVAKQVAALHDGDFDTFLCLVNESGRSSWEYLQNVIPAGYKEHQEVGVTIAAAKHLLGDKGAVRVHGGGFAGTVQAFVPVEMLDEFKAGMEAILGEGRCHVLSIRPEGGAVL